MSEFSEAFLLAAERHAAWGAARLESLTGFLPEGPSTAELSSCRHQQGEPVLRA
ncbi:hypothetical protein ACWDA8_29905 [Streptomyces sp. NPDC001130]